MIVERKVTRYRPICDNCGWSGDSGYRKSFAERQLAIHKCGEHGEVYSNTAGYRGVLGGYVRKCLCGERYVSDTLDDFVCPAQEEV